MSCIDTLYASIYPNQDLQGTIGEICSLLPGIPIQTIKERVQQLRGFQEKLQALLQHPVIEQRSKEWYNIRKTLLTASDLAQAIGKGKFGTRKSLVESKAGLLHNPFPTHEALKWGVMYEAVALSYYRHYYNNIHVHEFGLIQHPSFPIFGASPDGISDIGIMVELKCPWRRKIVKGEVPEQYYLQIQGQLEVCDLEECDYLECVLEEVESDRFAALTADDFFGIVVELTGPTSYIYSDPEIKDAQALVRWEEQQRQQNATRYLKTHFWVMVDTNMVRVKRDKALFHSLRPEIEKFWEDVRSAKERKMEFRDETD